MSPSMRHWARNEQLNGADGGTTGGPSQLIAVEQGTSEGGLNVTNGLVLRQDVNAIVTTTNPAEPTSKSSFVVKP